MQAEEFFDNAYRKLAVHIPGHRDKLRHVFSWEEFNLLLNSATLWSHQCMKMVLVGRDLTAEEFCTPGRTRDGVQGMLPDPNRVTGFLQKGATLILDLVERLSPGIAAVAASLEMMAGAPAVCNAYCSWRARQGFSSHFDSTDVFVLHIEGQKTWHLYEGRFPYPVDGSAHNYTTLSPEERISRRGKLLKEVVMKPGDILYIPRGQYHDAIAASDACLHLSFGLILPTGHDFLRILVRSLLDDPLFRQELPHFDDAEAYAGQLSALARRLHQIITDAETVKQARRDHRERALRDCVRRFHLPAREPPAFYRVCWIDAELGLRGDQAVLKTRVVEKGLSAKETKLATWILAHDYFSSDQLAEAFAENGLDWLEVAVDEFITAGLIDPL